MDDSPGNCCEHPGCQCTPGLLHVYREYLGVTLAKVKIKDALGNFHLVDGVEPVYGKPVCLCYPHYSQYVNKELHNRKGSINGFHN